MSYPNDFDRSDVKLSSLDEVTREALARPWPAAFLQAPTPRFPPVLSIEAAINGWMLRSDAGPLIAPHPVALLTLIADHFRVGKDVAVRASQPLSQDPPAWPRAATATASYGDMAPGDYPAAGGGGLPPAVQPAPAPTDQPHPIVYASEEALVLRQGLAEALNNHSVDCFVAVAQIGVQRDHGLVAADIRLYRAVANLMAGLQTLAAQAEAEASSEASP